METKNKLWVDTKGIADHFSLKPGTVRKQRSKQTKNSLPYHLIGGNVRYNILECERVVNDNKKEFSA
tara:strand:- start:2056 stop:2256 length:201 start_codon:yes stop_codon:yes gene_type:complete